MEIALNSSTQDSVIFESSPHVAMATVSQQVIEHATHEPIKPDIVIHSFLVNSLPCVIFPPIKFQFDFDIKTSLFEMVGEEPYDNIMVYGKTIGEALDVLEKEIFPILWGDVNGKDVKLSSKAEEIKVDLKRRVTI